MKKGILIDMERWCLIMHRKGKEFQTVSGAFLEVKLARLNLIREIKRYLKIFNKHGNNN